MCWKHFGADMFEKADYLKRTVFTANSIKVDINNSQMANVQYA